MPKKAEKVTKIGSRQELKTFLASQHRKEDCPKEPSEQLELGGWGRKQHGKPVDLMGGGAIVTWKYTCPTCKVVVLVEMS